jgi:hypothetical protein
VTTLRSSRRGLTFLATVAAVVLAACPPGWPHQKPAPTRAPVDRTGAKDAEAEQRAARLQVRLLEDEAMVEDLQGKLDDARQEVVRAMAKLQSLATRAEAASGMAEAEIALDSLKAPGGQQPAPEVAQADRLLQMSTGEFNKQNYGGALYLANQAKIVAGAGHGRLAGIDRAALRTGEQILRLPLRLRTVSTGNVREGPGTNYKVAFTLDPGAAVMGYSYVDTWLRVSDEAGRTGWIFYTLVGRRTDTN